MSKILFISGLSLIAAWVTGFLVFHVNATIHILLVIAGISLLISLLYNKAYMR